MAFAIAGLFLQVLSALVLLRGALWTDDDIARYSEGFWAGYTPETLYTPKVKGLQTLLRDTRRDSRVAGALLVVGMGLQLFALGR